MATNLRLSERAAKAVREEAEASGRSQQDVIRSAVDKYLGLGNEDQTSERVRRARAKTLPPQSPFREIDPADRLELPPGVKSSLELLDREDRF
jgi:hypothetical protein